MPSVPHNGHHRFDGTQPVCQLHQRHQASVTLAGCDCNTSDGNGFPTCDDGSLTTTPSCHYNYISQWYHNSQRRWQLTMHCHTKSPVCLLIFNFILICFYGCYLTKVFISVTRRFKQNFLPPSHGLWGSAGLKLPTCPLFTVGDSDPYSRSDWHSFWWATRVH